MWVRVWCAKITHSRTHALFPPAGHGHGGGEAAEEEDDADELADGERSDVKARIGPGEFDREAGGAVEHDIGGGEGPRAPAATEPVIQVPPPITAPLPITVSPPRIVAPA